MFLNSPPPWCLDVRNAIPAPYVDTGFAPSGNMAPASIPGQEDTEALALTSIFREESVF